MEPPSARPWLGVGAALSALPAAGGCFCAALVLAVVADSDPGAVYEQHRWLGAIVAASAVCAFVAMMGWATLRHGGLPLPVLLIALVVRGVPFLLPRGLFLPAAALAVAGCAALADAGPAAPAGPPRRHASARVVALAGAAVVLAISQAIGVASIGAARPAAQVLADTPHSVSPQPQRTERDPGPPSGQAGRTDAPRPAEKPALGRGRATDAGPARSPRRSSREPVATGRPRRSRARPRRRRSRRAASSATTTPRSTRVDFAAAWQMLSPAVQQASAASPAWRKGYARTVSNAPGGVTVDAGGRRRDRRAHAPGGGSRRVRAGPSSAASP